MKVLQQVATGASPVPIWLRVTRSGNQWTHEHSFDGTTWITNGSFSSVLSVTSVGVFSGNFNARRQFPGLIPPIFDYVFEPGSPIVPGGYALSLAWKQRFPGQSTPIDR